MSKTKTKPKQQTDIRWMIRADMPEVLAIEQACQLDYPWDGETLVECLKQRNCIGMVAMLGEQVVGFFIYELHQGRIQLLNFNVHPSMWRKGVGRSMIDKVKSKLRIDAPQPVVPRTRITAEIRETNLDAHLFFSAMGFKATGVLHDYYDCTAEDCYLFQFKLDEREAVPRPVADAANSAATGCLRS